MKEKLIDEVQTKADRDELRALQNKELSALARAGFNYDTARFVFGVESEDFDGF